MLGISTIATRLGQRKAMLIGSWGGIIVNFLLAYLWIFGDVTQMVSGPDENAHVVFGFFTIIHILLTIISSGFQGISGNIVIPMTIDCADYEVYRVGKYVPGLMGILFSFVDKIIYSLSPMLAGLMFAMLGYSDALPDVTAEYSTGVHYIAVFLMYGMVILELICNVIAIKFYSLTKEKMEEIQGEIAAIKERTMAGEE